MFFSTTEYFQQPRATESWLIQDLLPTSGRALLYGRAKLGKSFLGLQMAAAVADPDIHDFMGMAVRTHGPVAYLQVDTPREIWMDRLEKSFFTAGYSLNGMHWADTQTPGLPYPFNIVHDGCAWLRSACDGIQPVLVVVDTFAEIHQGDENDAGHLKHALQRLTAAIRPAALLIVSHSRKNKPENGGDITTESRGSNYLVGAVDVIMRLANEKRMDYESRASSGSLTLERIPEGDPIGSGLFKLNEPLTATIQMELERNPRLNQSELARQLQKLYPAFEQEAIRQRIKRAARSIG